MTREAVIAGRNKTHENKSIAIMIDRDRSDNDGNFARERERAHLDDRFKFFCIAPSAQSCERILMKRIDRAKLRGHVDCELHARSRDVMSTRHVISLSGCNNVEPRCTVARLDLVLVQNADDTKCECVSSLL